MKGFELVYEQPIGESFGFNANYTYADGETDSHLGRRQQQSGGHLEGHLQRGRVFREREVQRTCDLLLSHQFLIGLSGANPYYQDDFGTVSLALNYKPTEWINISLDALNLNSPTLTYYQSATAPTAFYNNGRQYYLNLRFKF